MARQSIFKKKENPFFNIIDCEMTSIGNGDPMEIAVEVVEWSTFKCVAQYKAYIKTSKFAMMSEPGRKHYEKVKDYCEVAQSLGYVIDTAMRICRGETKYDLPYIVGYNIRRADIPSFLKRAEPNSRHWIHKAPLFDVYEDLVCDLWNDPNVVGGRRLGDIAKTLGISMAPGWEHNPLNDCDVTRMVFGELLKIKHGTKKIPLLLTECPKGWIRGKYGIYPVHRPAPLVDLDDPANKKWALYLYSLPQYQKLQCPFCGQPTMFAKEKNVMVDGNAVFYWCPICGENMNMDGSVWGTNSQFKRVPYCSVEDHFLPQYKDAMVVPLPLKQTELLKVAE